MKTRTVCELYHDKSNLRVCYVPSRRFEGIICTECKRVVVHWSKMKTALWTLMYSWRWDGQVTVEADVKPSGSC
jgi:hypothetical protein